MGLGCQGLQHQSRWGGSKRKPLTHLGIKILHFGEHCAKLRKKVKHRLAHLRTLTGRSWGLQETQLRTIANGYVRGAIEHAAAAWLTATSRGHVELLDRELRAAPITGCPRSAPVAPLMAEAGLPTAQIRRGEVAARILCSARSLPPGDPLRLIAEGDPPHRLSSSTCCRRLGAECQSTVP